MALAALDEISSQSRVAAIPRSLQLQALLALLFSISDRTNRDSYRLFMDACTGAGPRSGETIDAITRGTYSKTHWYGIVRSLGYEPNDPALSEAVNREQVMVRDGPEALDRSIAWASFSMREQIWSREILATKGRPFSAGAKRLMAERLAQGKPIDGS